MSLLNCRAAAILCIPFLQFSLWVHSKELVYRIQVTSEINFVITSNIHLMINLANMLLS